MASSLSTALLLNSSKTLTTLSFHNLNLSNLSANHHIFHYRFKPRRLSHISNVDFRASRELISPSSSSTSHFDSRAGVLSESRFSRSFAACRASARDDSGGASNEVIILDVDGMKCDGCTSSVKRILESQPQVSKATADLAMKTATIWLMPEAMAADNWQQQLGDTLAKHLTNCGFKSNLRGQGAIGGNAH